MHQTPAEKMIWYKYLRKLEYRVFRQRPVDNYIVDFYCPKYKLVIEIDGERHLTSEGKEYDEERTIVLEQYGLKVIRFLNEDILRGLESVVHKIEETIEKTGRLGRFE